VVSERLPRSMELGSDEEHGVPRPDISERPGAERNLVRNGLEESPDRRCSRRISSAMQFRGWRLTPGASERKRTRVIQGQIENISRGGVSVLSSRSVPISSLVRCEIRLSQSAATIPTLMQVRWNQKTASGKEHRIGLQFIL
jgi:hypothetical protein